MKKISLNNEDNCALVDDVDYAWISKFTWHLAYDSRYSLSYAACGQGLMHRIILNPPPDKHIDHIDKNGLNNRRSNLRLCTISQNQMNRKTTQGTSRYKGVYWDSHHSQWRAEIVYKTKRHRIGYFISENKAALAYNERARALHRNFASLNEIFADDRFYPTSPPKKQKAEKTSLYKGITWDKSKKKWGARYCINGKKILLGRFKQEEEALHALVDFCDLLPENDWHPL